MDTLYPWLHETYIRHNCAATKLPDMKEEDKEDEEEDEEELKKNFGTSEGAEKAWDTRGRGRKESEAQADWDRRKDSWKITGKGSNYQKGQAVKYKGKDGEVITASVMSADDNGIQVARGSYATHAYGLGRPEGDKYTQTIKYEDLVDAKDQPVITTKSGLTYRSGEAAPKDDDFDYKKFAEASNKARAEQKARSESQRVAEGGMPRSEAKRLKNKEEVDKKLGIIKRGLGVR